MGTSVEEIKEKNDIFTRKEKGFVLLNVPSGKPNRQAKGPVRILQPSMKGSTCFYYAAKVSAILEADYLEKQKTPARKATSEFRKVLAKNNIFTVILTIFKEALQMLPADQKTKQNIVSYLQFFMHVNSDKPQISDKVTVCNQLIRKFQQSSEQNISKFLEQELFQALFLASCEFLKKIDVKPNEALKDITALTREKLEKLEETVSLQRLNDGTQKDKAALMFRAATHQLEKIYDLEYTSWKPSDKIQNLFDLIQNNGTPIIFHGNLGSAFYNKPAEHKTDDKIEGYEVWGWPVGSCIAKKETQVAGHDVVVIGVKMDMKAKGGGLVYFIDPMDSSDPRNARRIYKMSYEQFCHNCCDGIANAFLDKSDPRLKNLDYGRQRRTCK